MGIDDGFFDDLMTSLKKGLQFFQENRSWITRQMEMESVNTPDGGRPTFLPHPRSLA